MRAGGRSRPMRATISLQPFSVHFLAGCIYKMALQCNLGLFFTKKDALRVKEHFMNMHE